MDTYRIEVVAGVGESPSVVRTYAPEKSSGFGYKVDEMPTPGCFRFFFGRKTVIIPLQNLILVEMDL